MESIITQVTFELLIFSTILFCYYSVNFNEMFYNHVVSYNEAVHSIFFEQGHKEDESFEQEKQKN